MIDSAHTMIGNILRGTDVQIETLAEIEDILGIRIMHRHQAPAGADPEQRPGFSFGIPSVGYMRDSAHARRHSSPNDPS